MRYEESRAAIDAARAFIAACDALRECERTGNQHAPYQQPYQRDADRVNGHRSTSGCPARARVRRASMDLTRELARLRRI